MRIDARLSETPLDVPAAIASVSAPDHGAIALFVGTVRSSASVRRDTENTTLDVVALEYEAHPELAEPKLREIAEDAGRKWDVRRITAIHRTGHCPLGEATIVVACGAPHRADALEACRWIIDTVKETVPIWKKEIYADGSAWVEADPGDER